MKLNKLTWVAFGLLLLSSSLYRVWDARPLGFIPLFSMAIFSGMVIRNRYAAFLVPLVSLFASDLLYEVLYRSNLTEIRGFYQGQVINYLLIVGTTGIGMLVRRINVLTVTAASLGAPTLYFLISNLLYWTGGGTDIRTQLPLSRGMDGLLQSYNQALPFYQGAVLGTLFFSTLFFGVYYLLNRPAAAAHRTA
ncbi:MAG TPA: DUF6580 family putative transport protein [Chitinophagaceae bacterium]|nr:DUF6580 family putative transport protein [Chitinophagaceae bacterium]